MFEITVKHPKTKKPTKKKEKSKPIIIKVERNVILEI